jgi:colanic acid/amylovoran biosynthesis glycosyltransferase
MHRTCIAQRGLHVVSETFIRAHGERLSGVVGILHQRGEQLWCDDAPVRTPWSWASVIHALRRLYCGSRRDPRFAVAYEVALRRCRPDVVLAEYGQTGAQIAGPCRRAGVPFVVHFHGYDASRHSVIERFAASYRRMFTEAAAVIAVSRAMERQLLVLGCPRDKLLYSPYGIDCESFGGGRPGQCPPTFLAVGRFVDKKAPELTIAAFARVLRERPGARLRMIGDGPLREMCRRLVQELDIHDAVTFLGAQPHDAVIQEMRAARAFVQHSVVATDGDSEGTPVAMLEAGAMGLPVVATRHAGIPDVVVEGETGLLVDERDMEGMARHMLRLVDEPQVAEALGRNAAGRVRRLYTMEQSLARLSRVLQAAAERGDMRAVREAIDRELPDRDLPTVAVDRRRAA